MTHENIMETSNASLLQSILDELRRQRVPDDLWSADDIATFMKLKKSTVQSRITSHLGFPRPVRIPTTETGAGGKRWVAKEVKAWVLKQR